MKRRATAIILTVIMTSCANSQDQLPRLVGGPCEGCEAILEFDADDLTHTDTLPDFNKEGVKIKVEGIIYQNDGKTPASNTILYVYHTNQKGIYAAGKNAQGWGQDHGYNRTWLKTDKDGYYAFYTLKPAPYPNRSEPAHIHYEVLEPNGKYYYLASCHSAGDSLLTQSERAPKAPRGGHSGLLSFEREGDLFVARRDIVLGKNIPGYE